MSFGKKITALLASLAIVFSASGCGTGKNTAWAARYENYEVNAGIFIYYEMSAYYEAVNQASGENENLDTTDKKALKATQIDGKDMLTWIQDEATENLRKYLAVQAEFDNRGLELTDEEISEMDESVSSAWDTYGSYYEQNGIGEESFRKITELSYKSSALFESYYGEGGTDEVAEDEIKTYYDENYARVKYIAMNLTNADGTALDDDGKAEIKAMADDYVERANKGEDFDTLIDEYNEYLAELTATETTEAEEEIPAETEAIDETEAAVTEIPEETEESAENLTEIDVTVSEAEAENSENAEAEETVNADADTSDAEDETAVEETEEVAETSEVNSDESEADVTTIAETDDTEISEESEETVTENPYPNEQIIKKGSDESYSPSEIVNKAIFDCTDYEEAFFIDDTDNSIYYVAVRYDILEREDLFSDDNIITILNEMKGEDYDSKLLEIVTIDNVTLNDSSYKRYNPFDFEL